MLTKTKCWNALSISPCSNFIKNAVLLLLHHVDWHICQFQTADQAILIARMWKNIHIFRIWKNSHFLSSSLLAATKNGDNFPIYSIIISIYWSILYFLMWCTGKEREQRKKTEDIDVAVWFANFKQHAPHYILSTWLPTC